MGRTCDFYVLSDVGDTFDWEKNDQEFAGHTFRKSLDGDELGFFLR